MIKKNTDINLLFNNDTKRIVYVLCNTITLARDIDMLKDKYVLDKITLFDNFPNTKHVESVCLLEKSKVFRWLFEYNIYMS